MHKLLSKYLPSYRIISGSNSPVLRTDGKLGTIPSGGTTAEVRTTARGGVTAGGGTRAGGGTKHVRMDDEIDNRIEDREEDGEKIIVVSPNKRDKSGNIENSISVRELVDDEVIIISDDSDQGKTVQEEFKIKQSRRMTKRSIKVKKELKAHGSTSSSGILSSSTGRNRFKVSPLNKTEITNSFLTQKNRYFLQQIAKRNISTTTRLTSTYLSTRSQDDLSHFTQIRSWIPTSLGQAVWSGQVSNDSSLQFSVMNYNVLAQNLLQSHPYLYRACPSSALGWPYRWQGIKREVLDIQPDIVCLQEVQLKNPSHFQSQYQPFFDSLGYKHVMKGRTGTKEDGCVIFYKGDVFHLEEVSGLEYKIDRIKLLDRDNIGLGCRFVPINSPTTPLVIGTTHLLYNPNRADIRLCQMAMFLAELDRLARTPDGSCLPTILTGDFNSDQLSPVIQLLQTGSVQYDGLRSGSRAMPSKLLPDSLGLSDSCQWEVELEQRGLGGQFSTGTGGFRHKFGLRSVYAGSGVTTFQDRWTMVDYIMYSTDQAMQEEKKLKLVAKLGLPTERNMQGSHKIPSHICPSDHLPLVAQFLLTK